MDEDLHVKVLLEVCIIGKSREEKGASALWSQGVYWRSLWKTIRKGGHISKAKFFVLW